MPGARRKLSAVDDPLAAGEPAPPPRRRTRGDDETVALYVRLRAEDADRLARAAFELRVHKRELVGALIAHHVDGTTDAGRHGLRDLLAAYRASGLSR